MKAQARVRIAPQPPAAKTPRQQSARQVQLPHRPLMIARFGSRAAHVPALAGPDVAGALRQRGARAASFDGVVFLPDERAGPDLVAHEVAHALQQLDGGADPAKAVEDAPALLDRMARAPVVPEDHRAEAAARASEDTARLAPDSNEVACPADAASLRRTETVPADDVASAPLPRSQDAPTATEPSLPATPEPAAPQPQAEPAAATDIAPTFAPPEFVEPTLDPAVAAERAAAAAAAQQAMATADNPSAVMEAYATMAPSQQAQVMPGIGGRLGEAATQSNAKLGEATPEVAIETRGGEGPMPMPPPVAVPADAATIDLGAPPPPTFLVPDGPAQPLLMVDPSYGPHIERRFTESSTPERVDQSIDAVSTANPGIETRIADRAGVPRDGANDPQRLEDALTSQREQASALRRDAALAVVNGPGPERVQPRALEANAPPPAFPGPALGEVAPAPEAAQLQQMALPDAVVASFDTAAAGEMAASARQASEQMQVAETDRNAAHDVAVEQAETQRAEAERNADESQRNAVSEQRQAIQSERQRTVDDQNTKMAEVNAEAARVRSSKRQEAERTAAEHQRGIDARYDQAERESEAEIRKGEQQAESERQRKKREAANASWWERAVNFIRDAFNALVSLVNRIFDAVRSLVTGLIDLARRAVVGLIELASRALQSIVSALGELLKGLVDGLIGQLFPELAARLNRAIDGAVNAVNRAIDSVARVLVDAVNAIAATLTSAVNALLDVFQGALNTALAALQAALTGDWGVLLRRILDAVLNVLGIDPAAFHAMIDQASESISIIVNDPGRFVTNMIDVVVGGIRLFSEHFPDHFRRGIIGWLTGALGDIQIPNEWNIWTVLDLARQILGLTWDFVRERAARIIGPENVARLEMMASWIGTLITEGWQGLWTRIQESLATLRDSVLEMIRNFVLERVIMAAITWLASLFNPVGALVKLVMTIWNIYQFVRGQLQRLMGIAQAVVGAIANVARGVLEPGQRAIESILGNLVPVVIDLLMSLLGVTGVAARVREIIRDLRQRIADAVDRMLQRVLGSLGLGRGRGPAAEERAAVAGAAAAGPQPGQIGHPVRIDVTQGEDHTLTIERGGAGGATVMLRSDPRPLGQWLDTLAGLAARESDANKKSTAEAKIREARTLLNRLDPIADQAAATATATPTTAGQGGRGARPARAAPAAASAGTPAPVAQANTIEDQLGPVLKTIFDNLAGATGAFVDRFRPQIELAHPQAQEMLRRELRAHASEWQTLQDWPAVTQRLKAQSELFTDPLDSSRTFGATARTALDTAASSHGELKSRILTLVRQKIRDGATDAEYVALKNELHAAILDRSNAVSAAALTAAANKAATELNASGEADPALRAVVQQMGLDEFLLAMGKNQTVGGITPARFDELWHSPGGANKEFIASRFRLPSGAHEWIPTNYIPNVVAAARSAAEEEGIEAAAFWVKVHDVWRSSTELLIYKPETGWVRRIRVSGQNVPILQGHVGSVYARADDAGMCPTPQQQTIGQGPWHDRLRAIFDRNVATRSDSRTAIRNVIGEIETYADETLWRGTALAGLDPEIFDFYFASNRSTHIGVSGLRANAARSLSALAADFARARGVVA